MTPDARTLGLVATAAQAADSIKAEQIVAFNVSVRCPLTDVFLIASGGSDRQVGAIVDAVERRVDEAGGHLVRREGDSTARWVLLDYGEFVVHVQHADDREFYGLDRLWKDCPRVALPAEIGLATSRDALEAAS
ncbi:MAG: ribosome silencing factor [Bifidobacteriaceae bacterium]|jgi:ribosome-associated protein|nr:ribosome silencing factor [Bifidobacteriaceae bacterium]